jgi:hypothetical protein
MLASYKAAHPDVIIIDDPSAIAALRHRELMLHPVKAPGLLLQVLVFKDT